MFPILLLTHGCQCAGFLCAIPFTNSLTTDANQTIPPVNVLYFRERTTLSKLNQYLRVIAKRLYEQAVHAEFEITGPQYWLYHGMDGKPGTKFTLEIALPVQEPKPDTGNLPVSVWKRSNAYRPFTQQPGERMPETYGKLIEFIQANGYQMNGVCRELYLNIDFPTPENNITEVQIGII